MPWSATNRTTLEPRREKKSRVSSARVKSCSQRSVFSPESMRMSSFLEVSASVSREFKVSATRRQILPQMSIAATITRMDVKQRVTEIWNDVVGADGSPVSEDRDFFESGGDSF